MSAKTSVDPLRSVRFQLVGMPSELFVSGLISAPLLKLTYAVDVGWRLWV